MVPDRGNSEVPSIRHLWQGLNETTTAHGMPRAYQYKGNIKTFV